ncbi:MAG: 2Fe-2S ferredoxin [Bradymonadales bacterium]|nr:MAG: 2Fe-2S ferredoxin [Bradymonadales bacterium]
MPKIRFENLGESYEVAPGTSVLECAIDQNLPLDHDCGGNCACTTCHIFVKSGMQNLTPMSEDEKSLLEANERLDEQSRLGCQSRVKSGEVVVQIPE